MTTNHPADPLTPATRLRWLLAILAVGALLRIIPFWFGLPYRARPDEEVAIGTALRMLDGNLNPEFFHWPSLTFYVFAGVFGTMRIVTGLTGLDALVQTDHYFMAGRLVVAAAGTVTIFVLYRLARRLAGDLTGLVAAALLAVAMLHVRDSHFAMTDVLMTLLVTTSLALLLEALHQPDARRAFRWLAAAGLAGGLAASAKYNAAAVAVSMVAAQVLVPGGSWRAIADPRRWTPSLVYGVAFAAGFLVATPYAVLDARLFWTDFLFNVTHLSGGHGVDLGRGYTYHLTRSLPYGLGPTTFACAVLGMFVTVWRHPKEALVLGSFVAALYMSIGSGQTVFFRYVMPIVPVFCLFAAVGVVQASAWIAGSISIARPAALGLLLALTAGLGLVNAVWFDVLLGRTDTRVLSGRWLAGELRPGQSVYDSGGVYSALDLSNTPHHRWYFDADTLSFGHPEGRNPDWLVLHESPVFAYASTPPQVRALAQREYSLVYTARATRGRARSAVYDLQDAFFMPIWGFWTVERPGPTIRIYRHAATSAQPFPGQ